MNCRDISTQVLSECLDQEVAPEIRVRIEEHLRTCPHCQARARQLEVTVVLTRRLQVGGAQQELVVRLRRRILRVDRSKP